MKRLMVLLGIAITACVATATQPPTVPAKGANAAPVAAQDSKAPAGKTTVKLAGLEVYDATVEKLFKSNDPFTPQKRQGVTAYLWVSLPDQFIANVDKAGSELTSATDDRGTELHKNAQSWLGTGTSLRFAPEGNAVLVPVYLPKLPTAGAKEVTLKGKLGIKVAGDLEVGTWEGATKAGGTQGKIGALQFFGGKANMNFSANDPNPIKQITCFDKAGKPIKGSYQPSSGSGTVGDVTTYDSNYTFPGAQDYVKVEVKYATNLKTVVVPLELTMSLGF